MSRIGKKEILLPEGVTPSLEKRVLAVSGPKGSLEFKLKPEVEVKISDDGKILVLRKGESKFARAYHGTVRQVIANMVLGVKDGWSKTLEVVGTGYRATLEGEKLVLSLGFSHQVTVEPLPGISFLVEENKITVSGRDKVLVGQMAAKIRQLRPPDAYKGKGIRYLGEIIKLKPGKAAKTGTAL